VVVRFSALLTCIVYLFALYHHLAEAGFVDLPADGALALRRAVSIASLQDLPTRGNSIEPYYWFGVADDYLLAPFLLGAGSLEAVLRRCAMFHALCAPMAFAVGAVLRRPLLGLVFGLSLAALPDLVHLTGSYPLNYRTTHWALLALLGATLIGSSGVSTATRRLGAAVLLAAAALAVASHPFGIAALPAALVVCAYKKTWPQGRIAVGTAVGILLTLAPYLTSNLEGLKATLFGRGSDTRTAANEVLTGSLNALQNLSSAMDGLPGGSETGLVLLSGIALSAIYKQTQPALVLAALWIVGAYGAFLLAGYTPKTWHLRPCLYLGLGLGFAGWAATVSWIIEARPAVARRLAQPRTRLTCAALISVLFFALNPAPRAAAEDRPARGFGELSEAVIKLAEGRPFQYIEAQSHCPLNWSAEATLLDLHLRSGDFSLGTHKDATLLAAIERIDTFETHALASPAAELALSNGLAFRLHWNKYPQAWREQFLKYCPATPPTGNEEPFHFGGPGKGTLDSPCWVQAACTKRITTSKPGYN